MAEELFSFVYDALEARKLFPRIGKQDMVLAILGGIKAEPAYEACLIYEGPPPQGDGTAVCIVTSGPGAAPLQEKLVEAFEQKGIAILGVFEGGPPARLNIARADGGRWVAA